MPKKPTYKELEKRIGVLERENKIQKMDLESFRLSEERLRALSENTSDWIWEVNQDGISLVSG
jgi:PAS domain-containing protein